MMKPWSVLVLRPDASELLQGIQQLGGHVHSLPLFSIVDDTGYEAWKALSEETCHDDGWIFTSRYAVHRVIPWIQQHDRVQHHYPELAVIGSTTQAALAEYGWSASIYPSSQAMHSEGLLAHARLHSVRREVWSIFSGRDGRQVIPKVLRERGAIVRPWTVYQRIMEPWPCETFQSMMQQADYLMVTSLESVERWWSYVLACNVSVKLRAALVSSSRVKSALERYTDIPIRVAENPTAHALLQCLQHIVEV